MREFKKALKDVEDDIKISDKSDSSNNK